eukprot:3936867-Rhodomonas_salina.1
MRADGGMCKESEAEVEAEAQKEEDTYTENARREGGRRRNGGSAGCGWGAHREQRERKESSRNIIHRERRNLLHDLVL